MEAKVIRVVRDGDGKLLLKWVLAAIAEICDECGDAIAPGDEMAAYQDEFIDGRHWKETRHSRIPRTYCKGCGTLLEDSLTTTEAR